MKRRTPQKLPPGWTEEKVRAVAEYYDNQSDEEGAAEIESAEEAPFPQFAGRTWMSVPTKLVATVTALIKEHEKKRASARSRKRPLMLPRKSKSKARTNGAVLGQSD